MITTMQSGSKQLFAIVFLAQSFMCVILCVNFKLNNFQNFTDTPSSVTLLSKYHAYYAP